mgnify:CR=1 FL=1
MNAVFITLAVICAASVLWWMIKSEKGATCFAVSALQGLAAVFAVNLYTLGTAVLLGLPGVITALGLNLLLL